MVTMAISKDESPGVRMEKTASDSFHTGLWNCCWESPTSVQRTALQFWGCFPCMNRSGGFWCASSAKGIRHTILACVLLALWCYCLCFLRVFFFFFLIIPPGPPLHSSSASSDVWPETPFSDLYFDSDRKN